jgi:hypothetical protein
MKVATIMVRSLIGLPMAILLLLANGFLAWHHRESHRPLFRR